MMTKGVAEAARALRREAIPVRHDVGPSGTCVRLLRSGKRQIRKHKTLDKRANPHIKEKVPRESVAFRRSTGSRRVLRYGVLRQKPSHLRVQLGRAFVALGNGEGAAMRMRGIVMASSLGIFMSLYCVVTGACDLSGYDLTAPSPLRGSVSNNLVNFEYASDTDIVRDHLRIWNYVLNRRADRGIGVTWPKAGIAIPLWHPLPPGESACKTSSADWVHVDSDAPMTYGTTDQKDQASVYLPENQRKLVQWNPL